MSENIGAEKKKVHDIIVNRVYRIDTVRIAHEPPSDFMTIYNGVDFHALNPNRLRTFP